MHQVRNGFFNIEGSKEKMANITMNVTVDDIKPTIDKIISELAKEQIELSLQIVNGRPVISDQFGRGRERIITLLFIILIKTYWRKPQS